MNAELKTSTALVNLDLDEMARMKGLLAESILDYRGNKLTALQVAQLTLVAYTTGLNPLTGEIYMTNNGIDIGVIAYEKKAQQYMQTFRPGSSFKIHYRPATNMDAEFDPDAGDVAFVCIITRDDWDETWKKNMGDFLRMALDAGLENQAAISFAQQCAGPKPQWDHAGVVYGREDFSGKYSQWDAQNGKIPDGYKVGDEKPPAWSRAERAKKRARKGAIKHAFPDLAIPDPISILSERQSARAVQQLQTYEYQPALAPRSDSDPGEIIESMGYDVQPEDPAPEPASEPEGQQEEKAPEISRPFAPQVLQDLINERAVQYTDQGKGIPDKDKEGQRLAALLTAAAGSKEDRYLYCLWMLGHESISTMAPGQRLALLDHVEPKTRAVNWDAGWKKPHPMAVKEIKDAIALAKSQAKEG